MKKIAFPLLLACCLSSCGSPYVEDAFLKEDLLERCEIPALPKPGGSLLLYKSDLVYGRLGRDARFAYVEEVYDYLLSLEFEQFYALESYGGLPPFIRYVVKEASSFEDFRFDRNVEEYWFFFSREEIYQNTDGKDLVDLNILRIRLYGTTTISYDKNSFSANYDIQLKEKRTCFLSEWDYEEAES